MGVGEPIGILGTMETVFGGGAMTENHAIRVAELKYAGDYTLPRTVLLACKGWEQEQQTVH